MKNRIQIFKNLTAFAAVVLLFCTDASAQFSIKSMQERSGHKPLPQLDNKPNNPNDVLDKSYYDPAAAEARRKAIRKERNTIEFNASAETSLQQFENWTGSGSNNFYILTTIYFRHQYKKDKLTVDYRADANYGMNYIDNKLFKNKDEFKVSAMAGWTAHQNWSYSASTNFRSQFATGYKSRTDSTIVSKFMSPGYFDLAVGFTYAKQGSPFKVTLSPLGGNVVTVLDKAISEQGKYGVPVGESVHGKIGPSVDIYYDLSFGRKKSYRYRTNLYVFAGYTDMANPTFRWENTFDVRVSRFISVKLYGQLYYLKEASTAVQYQYSFMIGLKYVFKNK